jgi:hypothetical protein
LHQREGVVGGAGCSQKIEAWRVPILICDVRALIHRLMVLRPHEAMGHLDRAPVPLLSRRPCQKSVASNSSRLDGGAQEWYTGLHKAAKKPLIYGHFLRGSDNPSLSAKTALRAAGA